MMREGRALRGYERDSLYRVAMDQFSNYDNGSLGLTPNGSFLIMLGRNK